MRWSSSDPDEIHLDPGRSSAVMPHRERHPYGLADVRELPAAQAKRPPSVTDVQRHGRVYISKEKLARIFQNLATGCRVIRLAGD